MVFFRALKKRLHSYPQLQDLTGRIPEEWRAFNKEFIPIYLKNRPEKTKVAAGLACAAIWTVSKGMLQGDIVLCPDGAGQYGIHHCHVILRQPTHGTAALKNSVACLLQESRAGTRSRSESR